MIFELLEAKAFAYWATSTHLQNVRWFRCISQHSCSDKLFQGGPRSFVDCRIYDFKRSDVVVPRRTLIPLIKPCDQENSKIRKSVQFILLQVPVTKCCCDFAHFQWPRTRGKMLLSEIRSSNKIPIRDQLLRA